MYEDIKPWEKNLPANLLPSIKALRKSFDNAHWDFRCTTQILCFSLFHKDVAGEDIKEHLKYLLQLKAIVGPAATQRFHELLKEETPPAIFKAFYDLYLDGVSVQALAIFKDLVEIGRANEQRLGAPHLEWAEALTKEIIKYYAFEIELWVKNVCDKHVYDRNEDFDEKFFWRKWQAPMLIVMRPSRSIPYEPARVWERYDIETSSRLLKAFSENYVIHLGIQIDRMAGIAAVELAKQPKPAQTSTADGDSQQTGLPTTTTAAPRYTPNNARREARKLDTQARYTSWQKEYRSLKQSRPNMSDVWYSRQIAKMAIAKSSNAETIRKRMKR